MADTNARIMEMVRKELEKDRSVATSDLYEKAVKIDADVGNLTARQFHAKYPLQVKRALKGGGRRTAKKAGASRRGAGKRGAVKRTRAKKAAKAAAPAATAKRGRKPGKRAGRRRARGAAPAPAAGAGRNDVRGLLLQFAKQVAQADGKAEMVDVLAGLDTWVDRMVAAAR